MTRSLILTFLLLAFGAHFELVASEKRPQLIVVSVPGGIHADYYKKELGGSLQPILDMFVEYSNQVASGGDKFVVLYGDSELGMIQSLKEKFSKEARFLKVDYPVDIWMRDFSPVVTSKQVKFKYYPLTYLTKDEAKGNEGDFVQVIETVLQKNFKEKSNIILDGGNVVENGVDKAIMTDRVISDNLKTDPKLTPKKIREKLAKRTHRKVALITDPGDFTGHSDGLVSFVDDKTLLIGDYGFEEELQADISRIRQAFGNTVEIVRLPSYSKADPNQRSAIGCYVNMLVSDFAIYMPVFNNPSYDENAYKTVSTEAQKSGKKVFKVDTSKLGQMGGNVRCMSWQMYIQNNPIAEEMLQKSKPISQLGK